jgi:superfamily II DNA/RNA helicase
MDMIVATPGRLLDFIQSKLILLRKIKYLIIDEADRILEMGFEQQLNAIIYEKGKY